MTLFNSLGSNYTFQFVLQALFAKNEANVSINLKKYLKEKYGGEVYLLYKGREAIQLALENVNIPKESAVAINGFTCYAVYKAIKNAGLKPVYIDISQEELNFSPESLRAAIKENPKIKVLLIQNTLGYPCDIEEITKICKEKNIILIEDLAHSIGARYANEKEAGTIGDFTILSFSQDKMIDGISGGALIVRNPKIQIKNTRFVSIPATLQKRDRLYPMFTYLVRKTYSFGIGKLFHLVLKKIHALSAPMDALGEDIYILSDWYSLLIYNQFKNFDSNISHRKEITTIYVENLDNRIMMDAICTQINNSSNLRFPIFVKNRKKLIQYLKGYNVFISDIWYDAPIAPKKYMKLTDYKDECPNSDEISGKVLNLPTHKNISKKQAHELVQKINIWLTFQ